MRNKNKGENNKKGTRSKQLRKEKGNFGQKLVNNGKMTAVKVKT